MNWISLLGLLIDGLTAFIRWQAEKRIADRALLAQAQRRLEQAKEIIDGIGKVRADLRADLDAHPERVREPDPFSRD